MSRRVLIAGCGDVGSALGLRLAQAGDCVYGLRRNVSRLPESIRPIAADLLDTESLSRVPGQWDAVVYCPTPGEQTEAAYRQTFVEGLSRLAEVIEAGRFLYVSSTAVYAQNDGSWVDETSPTRPRAFNGRILLEGEELAAERFAGTSVVRFAGIYGPGRERLIRLVREGTATVQAEPPQWTNRIHREDCARMLQWLLSVSDPLPTYVGVDDRPAPRHEVLEWIARALRRPSLPVRNEAGGDRNKRVCNDRIRSTGFRFHYPDYRAGYGELIDGEVHGMGKSAS